MKSKNFLIEIIVLFFVTAVIYLTIFVFFEKSRKSKGPWEITFSQSVAGNPSIQINHPQLGISNVVFHFQVANTTPTNIQQTVLFDGPFTKVPFGTVILIDARYLPGTVVLNLFSNEVQVLPRALSINRVEYPWKSTSTVKLGVGSIPPVPGNPYKR